MKSTVEWTTGEGVITAEYTGSGNGLAVFSSIPNEGIDRSVPVSVTAKDGPARTLVVRQEGLREVFTCADGAFETEEGTFNVLKD